MDDYFIIGKIVNTQGNKGEVRILPSTDDLNRFKLLNKVLLKFKNNEKELYIENVRLHKNFVVIKFKDIDSMNDAEKIKNYELLVLKEDGIKLEENEYYYSDIYDSEVFSDEGEYLGVLTEIIETAGANDVYIIKNENEKDLLIPAVSEFIKEIDIVNKKIVVYLMKGLR